MAPKSSIQLSEPDEPGAPFRFLPNCGPPGGPDNGNSNAQIDKLLQTLEEDSSGSVGKLFGAAVQAWKASNPYSADLSKGRRAPPSDLGRISARDEAPRWAPPSDLGARSLLDFWNKRFAVLGRSGRNAILTTIGLQLY